MVLYAGTALHHLSFTLQPSEWPRRHITILANEINS